MGLHPDLLYDLIAIGNEVTGGDLSLGCLPLRQHTPARSNPKKTYSLVYSLSL
jgi:hypothetical protein